MNTNLNDYKQRVKRLRSAISSVLNIDCTQSQAYELIAKEDNYPNWDTLSGVIHKNQTEETKGRLSTKEQITQLLFFNEALKHGTSLAIILKFLIQQKNPILTQGWSKASSLLSIGKDMCEAFEETQFFNDDVLTLLKISSMTGTLESGIKSAIEFLKMEYELESKIQHSPAHQF